jgi:hypothetical protein
MTCSRGLVLVKVSCCWLPPARIAVEVIMLCDIVQIKFRTFFGMGRLPPTVVGSYALYGLYARPTLHRQFGRQRGTGKTLEYTRLPRVCRDVELLAHHARRSSSWEEAGPSHANSRVRVYANSPKYKLQQCKVFLSQHVVLALMWLHS